MKTRESRDSREFFIFLSRDPGMKKVGNFPNSRAVVGLARIFEGGFKRRYSDSVRFILQSRNPPRIFEGDFRTIVVQIHTLFGLARIFEGDLM